MCQRFANLSARVLETASISHGLPSKANPDIKAGNDPVSISPILQQILDQLDDKSTHNLAKISEALLNEASVEKQKDNDDSQKDAVNEKNTMKHESWVVDVRKAYNLPAILADLDETD